jgi:FkbM family methyltransferase
MKRIFLKVLGMFSKRMETDFLGSKYGGWYFVDRQSLSNSWVISCGVGTDISFDIELMQKYQTKIIFVDPTPEAISHMNSVMNSLGSVKKESYNQHGKQNIASYNLSNLDINNFFLENRAIYHTNNKNIKFYEPRNPDHVSHSISNWQNNYSDSTSFIKVTTVNLPSIIKKYSINNIEILKLDIEGAEYSVLKNMIKNRIYPNQILVEFDELQTQRFTKYLRYFYLILKLMKNYELVYTKNYPNFLFVKRKITNF